MQMYINNYEAVIPVLQLQRQTIVLSLVNLVFLMKYFIFYYSIIFFVLIFFKNIHGCIYP